MDLIFSNLQACIYSSKEKSGFQSYLPTLLYFLQHVMHIIIVILSKNIWEAEMQLTQSFYTFSVIVCLVLSWKAFIKLMICLKINVLELRT